MHKIESLNKIDSVLIRARLLVVLFIHIIDSQESFMELEGSYFDNTSIVLDMSYANTPQTSHVEGSVGQQIEHWEQHLRRFNLNVPPVVYHNHIPERSQSALSLAMNHIQSVSMTNKLGMQHGFVQKMRKLSRTEDTINLSDSIKKRRSRSADSRFSYSSRKEGSEKLMVDLSTMPSTSRQSRQPNRFISVPAPVSDVQIQVNGEGVDII